MRENDYKFSYTAYVEIDEKAKENGITVIGPKKITKRGMYNYCWPGCLTVMYDAEYIGNIQIEDIKKNNDYAIWLKIIKKTNCHLLKEKLAKYRIRQGSISRYSKITLIKHHYLLYRVGEKRNVFMSCVLTVRNLFWGTYKKIRYVSR